MKCSHTGHPFPHRLPLFLTQENQIPTKLSLLDDLVRFFTTQRGLSALTHYLGGLSPPREDYHLSHTTLGGYNLLERIIASLSLPWGIITPQRGLPPLSHYPGGLSPPREDYHLSLATLENCHPLIAPTITLGDYQPRNKVTCRPLLEYFFPNPFSAQLFWPSCLLPQQGLWVGNVNGKELYKKTLIHSPLLLRPNCERLKGISRNVTIVNQPTAKSSIFHPTQFGIIITFYALSC